MGVYERLNRAAGWTECRAAGALPAAFLNRCAARGVALLEAVPEDDFTLRVRIPSNRLRAAMRCAGETQCALTVVGSGGAPRLRRALLRRAVPAVCCLAAAVLLAWSKLFLWEIRVTGNETVPTARVLDALRECGVDSGTYWPSLTNDFVRSRLLLELPELAWAGMEIHGSAATVIVRERVPAPPLFDADAPTDLVASKSGFLTNLLVLRGAPQTARGAAVLEGETLISGAVGSRFSGTYLVHAVGDAEAETYYELSARMPLGTLRRTPAGRPRTRWALTIGKKRINFYRNSSFSGETCDKITSTYSLAVPGLFRLPVSLVRETERPCALSPRRTDAADAVRQMQRELEAELRRRIGARGEVMTQRFSAAEKDGCCTVTLRAACREHIAAERPMDPARIGQYERNKEDNE